MAYLITRIFNNSVILLHTGAWRIFVEGGVVDGVRVLRPETLATMMANRLTADQRRRSEMAGLPLFASGHGFGLGVAVVTEPEAAMPTVCGGTAGSVGWPGGASADGGRPIRTTVPSSSSSLTTSWSRISSPEGSALASTRRLPVSRRQHPHPTSDFARDFVRRKGSGLVTRAR